MTAKQCNFATESLSSNHKMKHLLTLTLSAAIGLGSLMTAHADAPTTGNPHELAQRFAGGKLSNMLFSTTVDPHWFQQGNKFWYSYKTAQEHAGIS